MTRGKEVRERRTRNSGFTFHSWFKIMAVFNMKRTRSQRRSHA
jgi:hypothetical protein